MPPTPQKAATPCSGLRFSGAAVSDIGGVRPNNEDNYILGGYRNMACSDHSEISLSLSELSGHQLAGVFDGMSCGEMGELAARESADVFQDAADLLSSSHSKAEADYCVRQAFLRANNRILDLQQRQPILGTTGTVLCTNGEEFKIYYLGDSRAYLLRDGSLCQLTVDQTLAQMKLEIGIIPEDASISQADQHSLTEYIGRDWTGESLVPVESAWISIRSGDCVLLCTDGLTDLCPSETIRDILLRCQTPAEQASALAEQALAMGGVDNITCVVLSFL